MSDGAVPLQALRFGPFELQPRERRLLVRGEPLPLGARAFDLLVALVSRAGRLVTKNELLDEVWPGLVVEEANLSVQVSSLRKVLGGGDLIATIPGRGYRFTGQVEVVALVPADGHAVAGAPASAPAAVAPASQAPASAAAIVPAPARPPAPALEAHAVHAPGLIGRDDELAALSAMLASPGCVTLVGPAGVGKTTLARTLAARAPQGAVWVDLSPLTAGEQVVAALARALGMPVPEDDVAGRLRAKLGARLLVLDNGEHVVDAAAALVSQLLQAEPSTHVLATSQLRLAVGDERVHRLEPLALPLDSDALDLHRGAVALFVERVRAADHRFHATPAQLPLLREICRRLDGLPLALEMAAARVPVLGLTGLAQALERRLAVLTGGRRDAAARHRTLQAALDWSHDLLGADEQRLYRTCGVFSGGFTLDLVVAVTAPGGPAATGDERWAVIDRLAQLVDRSLVTVDEGDPPRYRLLETMREDAGRRLASAGEEPQAQARRLAALADLSRRLLDPAGKSMALRGVLVEEHDNLREAIAWGRQQDAPALRADTVWAAVGAAFSASFLAWRLEARQWLESCESLAEGPDMPPATRARWWYERTRQCLMSRHKGARAMAEHTLTLYRELGDELGEFIALSNLARSPGGPDAELVAACDAMRNLLARHAEWPLGRSYMLAGVEAMTCERLGDLEGVLRCRLRELELTRQMGDLGGATAAETNIIAALHALGRDEQALPRARALVERLGTSEDGNAAYAWIYLLFVLRALGRFAEFRRAMPRAAALLRRHGLPLLGPPGARLLAAEGRMADALRAWGHARARFAAAGMDMGRDEQAACQQLQEQARAALGEAEMARCLAEGAAMDEAAFEALVLSMGRDEGTSAGLASARVPGPGPSGPAASKSNARA